MAERTRIRTGSARDDAHVILQDGNPKGAQASQYPLLRVPKLQLLPNLRGSQSLGKTIAAEELALGRTWGSSVSKTDWPAPKEESEGSGECGPVYFTVQ